MKAEAGFQDPQAQPHPVPTVPTGHKCSISMILEHLHEWWLHHTPDSLCQRLAALWRRNCSYLPIYRDS